MLAGEVRGVVGSPGEDFNVREVQERAKESSFPRTGNSVNDQGFVGGVAEAGGDVT